MEIKSPFSINDFLGYFIPGTISIFLIYINLKFLDSDSTKNIFFVVSDTTFYVYLIIISYILGHLFNYISSISIEQYSVWRYGYPSYYLLNEKKIHYLKWFNKNNLIDFFKEKSKYCSIYKSQKSILHKIIISIKILIFNLKLYPIRKLYRLRFRSSIWRIFLLFFIFPIFILDYFIGSILGLNLFYTNQIDKQLIKVIKSKTNYIINKYKIENITQLDYYFVINQYFQEKHPEFRKKCDLCNAQYRLCRSLSFIFSIASFMFTYSIITNENNVHFIWFTSTSVLLSFIFFMAFMKFYRLQTKLLFSCILIDKNIDV